MNNDKEHGCHHDDGSRQVKGKNGYLVGKRISFVFKHVEFEVLAEPFVEIILKKLKETGQG